MKRNIVVPLIEWELDKDGKPIFDESLQKEFVQYCKMNIGGRVLCINGTETYRGTILKVTDKVTVQIIMEDGKVLQDDSSTYINTSLIIDPRFTSTVQQAVEGQDKFEYVIEKLN